MKQAAVSATKRFPPFPLSLATHHHVAATHIHARCAAKIGAGLMNEYLFFHAVEYFALPMRVVYQIGPKQISFFLSLKLSNCKAMEKSTDLKSAHDEMHICRCCAVAGMLHSLSPTIFRGFSFFSAQKRRADSREGNPDYVRTHRQKKRGRGERELPTSRSCCCDCGGGGGCVQKVDERLYSAKLRLRPRRTDGRGGGGSRRLVPKLRLSCTNPPLSTFFAAAAAALPPFSSSSQFQTPKEEEEGDTLRQKAMYVYCVVSEGACSSGRWRRRRRARESGCV